mgnify:CR=1 FL=1|tara:strand:+ start:1264 stop:2493 length:1230 start_codon:yes stop_codon:yes gene_type:complete
MSIINLSESKEGKNVHLEHIEDMVFNEGVTGTRNAILFLRSIRDMLSGASSRSINITTKWDGAPAIFAGIDPADGTFFVAKKGLFNADPQMYKTPEDVKTKLSGELQDKFLVALREFSKLGIKDGVYQGDLMFTKSDLDKETIKGQDYITFQPNTIVYAVPAASPLARKIRRANIGVVWHTTYSGDSIQNMKSSFGKSIVNKMKSVDSVWMDDATYKDLSGTATFTKEETDNLTSMLSHAGKIFQKIPSKALNDIANESEFLIRLKAFNNTKVRKGKMIVNARTHVYQLIKYFREHYQKEVDKRKSDKGKQSQLEKMKKLMVYFDNHKNDLIKIYEVVMLLTSAKNMIVNKLNQAGSIPTFLRTSSGFKVTDQEGYVAIDKVGGAVKLVDRMEFSKANFSPDIIKGWQK